MSNSPNTSGRRQAGRLIGIGGSKGSARKEVARRIRREGKAAARLARTGREDTRNLR